MTVTIFPTFAQDENEDDDNDAVPENIELELEKKTEDTPIGPHRAPAYMNIDAYYNPGSHIIDICYYGECSGEVFLYRNNILVDYTPELNTSFQLTTPGLYKVVIIEESWVATGVIKY